MADEIWSYFRVVETPIVPNKGQSSVDFYCSSSTITGLAVLDTRRSDAD